jgi:pimeloyl-ACP methyl ester carboxylesterase
LRTAAAGRGIRLVSYGRPLRRVDPVAGRDVAAAADDVAAVADALGVDRFAVMGASGGGPHALACAALLPDRVTGAVVLAGVAPFDGTPAWFEGMADPSGLRAAAAGRPARAQHALTEEFDESSFVDADWAALAGTWASLGRDAGRAGEESPGGLIDDDVAFASPWGADLGAITAPVLLVQGGMDRVVPPSHADRLLAAVPSAQLWLRPADGHISVLAACPVAMDWLLDAT